MLVIFADSKIAHSKVILPAQDRHLGKVSLAFRFALHHHFQGRQATCSLVTITLSIPYVSLAWLLAVGLPLDWF